MGLALSSSWNAFRHTSGCELLFEIEKAGFNEVELSFNLTASMVTDIEGLLKSAKFKIVSLHNYCPAPEDFPRDEALPDCYSLSSPDSQERSFALKYTKRTIDTADILGARAVILHCGRVEVPDRTRELIDLCNKGLKGSTDFEEVKSRAIVEREDLSERFLEHALRSLDELNRYAQSKGISLGVETRFYYREIPSFQEIGTILDTFKGSNIFYWHDAGHAAIMDYIGLARQQDFLDAYAKEMIGIHLHDVLNGQDHMAPGKGKLDFNRFTPYLKKETIKVIEAHHPATAIDLAQSKEFLGRVFHGVI